MGEFVPATDGRHTDVVAGEAAYRQWLGEVKVHHVHL